ncbi:MAG: hypothetical protein EXR98_20105 [Gemmataceae bacterium]|nr:hypothetical protein [Gemmataceae bacterium]
MLTLLFILLVAGAALTVLLWGGAYYFQGYIYTEPSPGIYWQAPAAAAMLTLGYTIWCLSITMTPGATPQNRVYDTIIYFSPTEDMLARPASPIWAIKKSPRKGEEKKDGEKIKYVSNRDPQSKFYYQDTSIQPKGWQAQDVIAIAIEKPDGTTMRFNLATREKGDNDHFVSPDGWTILASDTDGPTGRPTRSSNTRLFWNLFFNVGHFVAWFLGLWVILRFQWSHALGFAVVTWLIFTLAVLPMMLGYAGLVAAGKQTIKTVAVASGLWVC